MEKMKGCPLSGIYVNTVMLQQIFIVQFFFLIPKQKDKIKQLSRKLEQQHKLLDEPNHMTP